MVWNRYRPQNVLQYPLRGGDNQLSEVATSWQREELSIAFSGNEGATWTDPVVLARNPKTGISYPYVFEVSTGRLWITTFFQGKLCVSIMESDFVAE